MLPWHSEKDVCDGAVIFCIAREKMHLKNRDELVSSLIIFLYPATVDQISERLDRNAKKEISFCKH